MEQATPRVLVVDDGPELRSLLDEYLTRQGFAVVLAADAAGPRPACTSAAASSV